jgi:mannosyl-3-phosphoglycerate phosphatase
VTAAAPTLLVFTDLDGTLLDDAYRFTGAEAALARLAEQRIPLVLATSKTRAELKPLSAQLPGVPGLIFENGAGITCPGPSGPQTTLFGPGYAALLAILESLGSAAAPFEGFASLGPARVEGLTGLAPRAVTQAMAREASEPGLFHGDEKALARFRAALAPHGLRAVHGGRFLHVMPKRDKVDGLRTLAALLAPEAPTLALGDGENDRAMLEAATFAVVMPRKDGTRLALKRTEGVTIAPAPGPEGWGPAVLAQLRAQPPTRPN